MYKMFLISSNTSAKEVVEQGLEKANIIDDPRCFALYEVYDSSQGKKDCLLIIITHNNIV